MQAAIMQGETLERNELERRLADLVQQHRDLVERLQQGQNYFQRLARSVWRVQEDERRRLARELHDGIGQNLTAIVHLLGQSLDALPLAAESARAGLEKIRTVVETTLDETRALSRLLRPQILDDLGLEAALRWLARTVGQNHALDIRLDLAQPLPPLDDDRCTLIFRVLQEALTNVARHAQATRVDIALRQDADRVQLLVHDDGRGCDPAAAFAKGSEGHSGGMGGMRDRVRLFSGEFNVRSQPGAGFRIVIEFPLHTNTKAASA
ncbi:MAG: sensor histidine kinase [Dokdonella sp.]